ncbi:hypothetical protein [Paenibacillus cymbidii]|uniref:hypothetical protein n=1 Tax=Paenibacillus cymbidii TaxID=1639034 RepID=UPI00108180C8|nr:hypothetical protein [Paenibacillus cymbidii]
MDEDYQTQFRSHYFDCFRSLVSVDSFESMVTSSLISAFHQSFNREVNGIISMYLFDHQGIKRLGAAENNDSKNWVAYAPDSKSTVRFVNGKQFGWTKADFKELKTKENLEYGDK